jgi:ferric-dicitrate binding protein FerR (iron transport regulator)
MTDDRRSPLSPEAHALDEVVREAKIDLVPRDRDLDWAALEARVMDRVAKEPAPAPRESDRGRVMRFGALALAAAAAIAVVVRKDRDAPLLETTTVDGADRADALAGSLRATEGAGEVRVGGLAAVAGQVLRPGDVLEADGARAVLERPRKVTWLLEKADGIARARVKAVGEALVVALDDGAIEAQVTPVPSGEAFAVDVAAASRVVRVAVHGTHFRVTRTGSRVAVDLSEGVVSIGVPPRSGSTYGSLVTAPAHVDFDVADLAGTLHVDHAPAAVRPPVPLAFHEASAALAKEPPSDKATAHVAPAQPQATVPRPTAASTALPEPTVSPAEPVLAPREAIAAAVRDCAATKSVPGAVRVTVTSTLKLQVGAGGVVESAQFFPPLQPEVQTCAAGAIYRAKLEEPGVVTIPIDFSY